MCSEKFSLPSIVIPRNFSWLESLILGKTFKRFESNSVRIDLVNTLVGRVVHVPGMRPISSGRFVGRKWTVTTTRGADRLYC